MKQMSLGAAGFERKTKRTRKREFLDEMNLVVPWSELVALVTPHAPARGTMPPTQPPPTQKAHNLDPNGYCWMYGYSINVGHSSATCTRKVDSHEPTAMRANPMGGSIANKPKAT